MFAAGPMAEKSSWTVPIIVAVIGVVGTISTALIANWDKLSGNRSAAAVHSEQVHQEGVPPAAAPGGATTPAAAAAAATPIDISGTWRDDDGYSYVIEQRGDRYHFTQYKSGAEVGTGDGHVDGKSLTHNFTATDPNTGAPMQGVCNAQLSGDARQMGGLCRSGTNSWPVSASR
jgi:hypothetical protein